MSTSRADPVRAKLDEMQDKAITNRELRLGDALRAVLDLHSEERKDGQRPWCAACGRSMPCPTVRAIANSLGIDLDEDR